MPDMVVMYAQFRSRRGAGYYSPLITDLKKTAEKETDTQKHSECEQSSER